MSEELTIADYEEVLADKRRLTKEIDVAIFGTGGAERPAMCDVLGSIKRECGERGVSHLMAAVRAPIEVTSQGAFRMGARAMRQSLVDYFAGLVAERVATRKGRRNQADDVIAACAVKIMDRPLPDFPAQPEPLKQVWRWWSGGDGEWFTNGPCATREEAIGELCGEGGHLVEALAGVVHFSAERLIADQYFEDDQGFDYDHSEPDRVGGADVIAAADAELQALLDGWLTRWGHTFVKPSLFAATRNAEYVEPDAAEAAA